MRPKNWFDLLDERIERAKALGWEAVDVGNGFFIMNDPAPSQYSGLDDSERGAFIDVLADAELWDEVTALLYPGDKI